MFPPLLKFQCLKKDSILGYPEARELANNKILELERTLKQHQSRVTTQHDP